MPLTQRCAGPGYVAREAVTRRGGERMNAEWFDAFARTLAGRRSRRSVLRGTGAGVTASLLAVMRPQTGRAVVARQETTSPYVVVRQYPSSTTSADLQQALGQGYGPLLAQQPGFIEYTVVDDGTGITSITVFASQDDEEAATNQVAGWVEQNLASVLPAPATTTSGTAFVNLVNQAAVCPEPPSGPTPTTEADTTTPTPQPTAAPPTATAAPPTATAAAPTATALPVCTDPSRPGVGCACSTGTEDPCGDSTLLCCANDADTPPGGPGTCTPSSVGCDPLGPTPEPTPCTGVGCPCTAGVEGTCDAGLVCCQSEMNAPNTPGGPGQCATPDGCGDGDGGAGATPVA
jgi:hypothetical protein